MNVFVDFNKNNDNKPIETNSSPNEIDEVQKKEVHDINFDVKSFKAYIGTFFKRGTPLAFTRVTPFIQNVFSFYMLAYFENAYMTGGYGFGYTMFSAFYQQAMIVTAEALGILCTRKCGDKNHDGFLQTLYRGFALCMIIICFDAILFGYIDSI